MKQNSFIDKVDYYYLKAFFKDIERNPEVLETIDKEILIRNIIDINNIFFDNLDGNIEINKLLNRCNQKPSETRKEEIQLKVESRTNYDERKEYQQFIDET